MSAHRSRGESAGESGEHWRSVWPRSSSSTTSAMRSTGQSRSMRRHSSSQRREARRSGEAYLLERKLFRRLSTGEPADARFLHFLHPNRWRYDVLRALDYFRAAAILAGTPPDPWLGEAIDHVRARRLEDGTWLLDGSPSGRVWFEVDDGPGKPSRWVTLRAMRVLRWWEGRPG